MDIQVKQEDKRWAVYLDGEQVGISLERHKAEIFADELMTKDYETLLGILRAAVHCPTCSGFGFYYTANDTLFTASRNCESCAGTGLSKSKRDLQEV